MRITLGGGGTDVIWYSRLRGGAWISAAINKYIYITLREIASDKLRINEGKRIIRTDNNIPNEIVSACLRSTNITKGLTLSILSDTEPKSGLGGSGALEVGLLNALYSFKKVKITKLYLAKKASEIEIKYLKRPVGPQDQYIASLGGIKYFEIDKSGNVSYEPLQLSENSLLKLKNNLLFFKTGLQRDAANILASEREILMKEFVGSENIIKNLDKIKSLGQQIKKFLLEGKIDEFGYSLHKHWLIKRALSHKVSNTKIEKWYNEALKAGALGGKIMGAGGGGWLVFYVNKNKTIFRKKMKELGLIEQGVNFDWEGTKRLL